ncbi:hypothetical protein [Francisella hispaniensis]|uniref:hypothetical protein n=1 Tax=Francisella hispaniensis TaxID=622488 RepID=UPI0019080FD5|nr:hypothetical protein [Francisella hispaniensis]MBK2357647.1 hypothetical protein [Francisella hispaniensis]
MKKKAILALGFLPLIVFAADDQQIPLESSDYITTDVGATYTYVYNHLDKPTKLTPAFDLTVKNCNENKTKCVYETKTSLGRDKPYISNESVYELKDGVVYFGNSKVADQDGKLQSLDFKLQPLFPKHIILNKVDKINSSNDMSHTTGTSEFTKVIPEIVVNDNTYKDCIRMDNNTKQCYKKDYGGDCYHTIDYEIYCKGIGLVTENVDGDTLLLEKITKK